MILESALLCLALNVYHEARGEPLPGQYGVANVTMNRAKTPDNVCRVVTEKRQFSWTNRLVRRQGERVVLKPAGYPKDAHAWQIAWQVAQYVISNPRYDFTQGATHYHAAYVSPQWRHSAIRIKQMGAHIFYRMT